MVCKRVSELKLGLKARSHLPQQSVDSAVDCINAEIEIFLSLCINAIIWLHDPPSNAASVDDPDNS